MGTQVVRGRLGAAVFSDALIRASNTSCVTYLLQCPVPEVTTASSVKLQLFLISLCHCADGYDPGGEVEDIVQHCGGDGS